jgi:hypothetical protein
MSTPAPESSPSDALRPWFELLEEMGEFIGIRYGRVHPVTREVEWMYLSHAQYDGIGAFAELLRERGAEIPELPQITHPARFSLLSFLRFLPALGAPRKTLKWKPLKQGAPMEDTSQPPPAVAFHVFNEQTTIEIRRLSRLADVTVNSFLMKYLDRAIRPSLEDPTNASPWLIPVNLRGRVSQPRETENHSSYVGIKIYASESVRDIQTRIYDALAKGAHLAAWMCFKAGKFASDGMKRKMIVTNRATSQWSLGGFSNLGDWDSSRKITAEGCLGDWLFAPPVLRSQMVGAGCVTFQGRLSLTIQIHPDLTTSKDVAEEWLHSWVREIELGLPSLSNL